LANKALLDKKLLELKQISVHDATPLLAEGADHFAISLGLFATAEAASAYLDTLKQRGVRSAIIQPRPSPAEKARLEVRASRAFWQNKLPDLLAETDLSAAHPENCPSAP
jgi:hypothetical protein